MIKRLYLVNGNLTQPLDKNDENIAVDANTAIQLATLNTGDWCYLTLLEEYKLEVIKITRFPSWYWVDRAQDNTCKFSFSSKAKIVYRLTTQEIKDAVIGTPLSIYPDGYGAIEVNNDNNSWQIKYTELNVQTLGGISWMNPDGYEVVITDNNGMFGCCGGNLTGAPFAGGIPFYLTGQIYSLNPQNFDSIAGSLDTAKNASIIGYSILLGGRIEPYSLDWVNKDSSIIFGNSFGAQSEVSASDMYVFVVSNVLNGYVSDQVIIGNMSNVEEVFVDLDSYILEGFTWIHSVKYAGNDGFLEINSILLNSESL